jgi:hypothetical protein
MLRMFVKLTYFLKVALRLGKASTGESGATYDIQGCKHQNFVSTFSCDHKTPLSEAPTVIDARADPATKRKSEECVE